MQVKVYGTKAIADWDTYLGYYNFIYNSSHHDTTHEKPSFLLFNRNLNLPFHSLDSTHRQHYFPCDNYVQIILAKMQYVYHNIHKKIETSAEKQFRLLDKFAKQKSFELV